MRQRSEIGRDTLFVFMTRGCGSEPIFGIEPRASIGAQPVGTSGPLLNDAGHCLVRRVGGGGARKDCGTDRERDYQCLMVFHAARCQRPYFLDVWRI